MSKTVSKSIWKDVTADDFRADNLVDDADIAEFNKNGMIIYQANVNYARQIARVEDSLKPIERRALYTLYALGATPGNGIKSTKILGSLIVIHNHSDASAYSSIIDMAQYWKNNAPLVSGNCNLGDITAPKEFAAQRYTELHLTKYAYECFFSDYDKKVINTNGLLIGVEEPELLPSKFPNILVNGNSGIGNGYATNMPPFNINDIITVCKKVIMDPDVDVNDLVIAPDFPTECDIVDSKSEIKEYCTTGKGKVTVRARIDIEETKNSYLLIIRSIPYTVPFPTIKNNIIELGKAGVIQLKAIHEESDAYVDKDGSTKKDLYFDVEIPKAADPIKVQNILYKNCDLEKTISLQATVVVNDYKTTIKTMNIKELILAWLNNRRMYKRSSYNHKINQIISNIAIDKAMIVLLSGKNLDKTLEIIRNSTTENIVKRLMTEFKGEISFDSYQATLIAQKPLSAFTKDSLERYKEETKRLEKQLDEITKIAYDPEKIDEIILNELDDLKKYAPATRRSKIIKVDNDQEFMASNHRLIVTSKGYVKKLPEVVDSAHQKQPYGSFVPNDRILFIDIVNNVDAIMMFNDRGKYSIIPIRNIENTLYNQYGESIYTLSKLDGKIVATHNISGEKYKPKKFKNDFVLSLSEQGFMKRTALTEFITADIIKPVRNSTAAKLRENDKMQEYIVIPKTVCDELNLGVLVYTKYGEYVFMPSYESVLEFGKNASGLQVLAPKVGDACVGFQLISAKFQKYAIVITKKGCMKRIELEYLGESKKRKDSSYIATIREDDEIVAVIAYTTEEGIEDTTLRVSTKNGDKDINIEDIPILGRKAKPVKMQGIENVDVATIVHDEFQS